MAQGLLMAFRFPVANHEWHNSLELLEPMWVSHLDHTVDGCEIHQLVDVFSP